MVQKILSLDGGGTWAMLEAMALQDLFPDMPGLQILAHFDMAVANSGGSIVLGGLVENMTPNQIIALFNEPHKRAGIFAKASVVESLLSHIPIFPRYSTAGKLIGLKNAFGTMGDIYLENLPSQPGWPKGPGGNDVRIMIVAFGYDSKRACFFRSYGTAHGAEADEIPLVEAVHASSDAPVRFFDAPTEFGKHRYWDGAMAGLNNPLMAAVIDLLGEGVKADEIVALSLGTGAVRLVPRTSTVAPPPDLLQATEQPGVIADLAKAAGCITDDPPDTATFSTHIILSAARGADPTVAGPVVRLSPMIRPILDGQAWRRPDGLTPHQFDRLTKLSMDAVDQPDVDLITALGNAWIAGHVRNQAIRTSTDDLTSSVGEDIYADAKARWLTL